MKAILVVFLGGGLGSLLRFLAEKWIGPSNQIPISTLLVNMTACLVLGLLVGLADHRQLLSPATRLFWTVGFCGGFSTFSAVSQRTLELIQNGAMASALLYVGLSFVLCLGASWVGWYLGSQ